LTATPHAELGALPEPRAEQFALPDARSRFLLHLSDTHFVGGNRLLYGEVDVRARLGQLLDESFRSGARPEAVIITGDLADAGEAEAYRDVRDALREFERRGARLIWLMGNHDDPRHFRYEIFDDHEGRAPLYGSHFVGGLRIIALDTSVRGFHHGEVGTAQLEWLSSELKRKASEGTILAMHHPPIRLVQPLARTTELRDMDALADVVRGSDVRLILAGHLHTSSHGLFAGIPVSVASATSYSQDTNVLVGGSRGRDGAQSVSLVHVFADSIVTTVSPIGTFSTAGKYVSPQEVADLLGRDAGKLKVRG
jgi:Icc protein